MAVNPEPVNQARENALHLIMGAPNTFAMTDAFRAFVEQLRQHVMQLYSQREQKIVAETHRIEVAGRRPDAAPDKSAAPSEGRSALDTVATRIDHVVVAVHDLAGAIEFFTARLGFHDEPLAGGDSTGIAALTAGGVTVVLVGAEASDSAARYLADHGSGVQHIAVEVLDAPYARASLDATDAPLLTDVVVDDHGHEQFFTIEDPSTGVQVGFISRTGHRVGVSAANVRALFDRLV